MRISKRRIRLGIGLDHAKLTGTIEHLCGEGRHSPALICSDPADPHAWIHLECSHSPGSGNGWSLIVGFPHAAEPIRTIEVAGITLPPTVLISNYEYGIFLTLMIQETTEASVIASLISDIMIRLQGITDDAAIEVSLEDN